MTKSNGVGTTADDICAVLREQISAGVLPPNARVTETGLAETFGTSRTPVREAMRLLVAEGFLSFKPNSGSFVRSWSGEEIEEIFDIRLLVESSIAESAARNILPEELAEMEKYQAAMERLGVKLEERSVSETSRFNREFHKLISQASRRPRLVRMLEDAVKVPIVQSTFSRYTASELQRSHHHHRELIDAFRARNPDWARAVMQCHISSAREVMRRNRRQSS
ncbi:GntR family transcriptional regulator [Oceanibacterium hippocampi]|uniref:HTH-type transcriptional regulator McbR n=1 Tax=Oceanibacterium hippocampi TaxID=745714 RepID=A0A1Y5TMM8_9PROT|nr:GntR family transcriptional regulator [Oceanibacterium hippocampi]SLN65776.1 HTH-type transcriptional regulator McbR [Oceanibacterium hippocampi]